MAVLHRLVTLLLLLTFLSVSIPSYAQSIQVVDMYYRITPSGTVNPNHSNLVRTLKLSVTMPPPGSDITVTSIGRDPGPLPVPDPLDPPGSNFIYDHTWLPGVQYTYYMTGYRTVYDPMTMMYVQVPWTGAQRVVTPVELNVGDNATADSRLDKRYSSVVHQDYKFNDANSHAYNYRGGLYAGNNSDGSGIGRAFLKFALVGNLNASVYPVGGLYLFSTRLTKTGSVTLVAQKASSTSWTQSNLVWSNAPALSGTTSPTLSVSWNSSSPATAWYKMNVAQILENEFDISANPTITLGIRGSSETGGGWAYFARKEFSFDNKSGFGPRLLYAIAPMGL